MKRIAILSFVGINILTSVVLGADIDTPAHALSSADASSAPVWTAEEQVLGEEFVNAAYGGNGVRTEEILMQNPLLIHFKDYRGDTALTWAAYGGHAAIAQRLIAAGADVNAQNNDGQTALMNAASFWGHAEIVSKLIAADANVNAQSNNGWTPLMLAAVCEQTEIVERLLAADAHSEITNKSGKTALQYAQEKGNTAIIALLQNHVDIEPEEETLMVKPALSELME